MIIFFEFWTEGWDVANSGLVLSEKNQIALKSFFLQDFQLLKQCEHMAMSWLGSVIRLDFDICLIKLHPLLLIKDIQRLFFFH